MQSIILPLLATGLLHFGEAHDRDFGIRDVRSTPVVGNIILEDDHFVAFCGRAASSDSRAGHAFVIIGKGTPMTCDVENGDGEAFGFYPSRSDDPCEPGTAASGKEILLRAVPGCLLDDAYTPYDSWVVVKCSFVEYLGVVGILEGWREKPYRFGEQDCLTFMSEVAKQFPDRLVVPSRSGLDTFPHKFVERLKEMNPKL